MPRSPILGDRRLWLLLAFALAMAGFPRVILTEWITQTGNYANTTHPGGADFVNYWVASQMTLAGRGAELFDPALYAQALIERYGDDLACRWLYPPHFLFFVWPLALVPYWTAYALFEAATLAFFLVVAAKVWGGRQIVPWLLLAPVTALGILHGQTVFLVGGLLIGGIFWRESRPVLAGIFLGLLTIKPQFGVLIPLLLLLERRWLVIAVAGGTTILLALASAAIFGVSAWESFLLNLGGPQGDILRATGGYLTLQLSTFGAARFAGASVEAAGLIQAASSIFAVLALVATALSGARGDTKAAMLVAATYLFTPYVLYYDLAAASFVALWLYFGHEREAAPGPLLSFVALCVPLLSFINGATVVAGYSAGPFVFAAFAAAILWRARSEHLASRPPAERIARRPIEAAA